MKRNWDLIRDLLLCVEESNTLGPPGEENWPKERLYHVRLLYEAGLIDGIQFTETISEPHDMFYFAPEPRMTWHGHDLLDAIRDDSVWSKTKDRIADVAGVTLPILVDIATEYLKKKLGLGGTDGE